MAVKYRRSQNIGAAFRSGAVGMNAEYVITGAEKRKYGDRRSEQRRDKACGFSLWAAPSQQESRSLEFSGGGKRSGDGRDRSGVSENRAERLKTIIRR